MSIFLCKARPADKVNIIHSPQQTGRKKWELFIIFFFFSSSPVTPLFVTHTGIFRPPILRKNIFLTFQKVRLQDVQSIHSNEEMGIFVIFPRKLFHCITLIFEISKISLRIQTHYKSHKNISEISSGRRQ